MLRTKFSQFRAISIIEGISYLILVFLAMPLKYLFEEPMAVKIFASSFNSFRFANKYLKDRLECENLEFSVVNIIFLFSIFMVWILLKMVLY